MISTIQIEPAALDGVLGVPVTGMVQVVVGTSFLYAVQTLEFGVVAMPEPFRLWENVPNPVALFLAIFDFLQGSRVITLLGVEETLEGERDIHKFLNYSVWIANLKLSSIV